MTKDTRKRISIEILCAPGLILGVSHVEAAASSRELLQAARAQAAHELADLKAELSRETQKRLASYTYEFETNEAEPVLAQTRVASTVVVEDLAQAR